MTASVRALWRFLRRDGGDYVFARLCGARTSFYRVPVERFWGGAR